MINDVEIVSEYKVLFEKLARLQGTTESKIRVLKKVMNEALRFKRHSLAKVLTQKLEEIGNGVSKNLIVNGHNR